MGDRAWGCGEGVTLQGTAPSAAHNPYGFRLLTTATVIRLLSCLCKLNVITHWGLLNVKYQFLRRRYLEK